MSDAAISFAVERLGSLLIKKAAFLQGVEGQVRHLNDGLKRMRSFLKDASDKEANDERIRNWISEIREVAQDTEDVIDIYILKIDNPRRRRGALGNFACFPAVALKLNDIGKEIESIQARLDEVNTSREAYGIQNLGSEASSSSSSSRPNLVDWRRRLSPWQPDRHVVGLEKDSKKLLKEVLLEESTGLSIATIVGMGGIGKSCLARHLYNHKPIVDHFDLRVWVCVSSDFNHREVIKELMVQLVQSPSELREVLDVMEKTPATQINGMIHKLLEDKRYFVVLDDVWENGVWEVLQSAFPQYQEGKASRLLLTSRNQVATMSAPYIHEMKLLDEERSWDLLMKKAFVDRFEGKCPHDLEVIGRELLKKCGGLPLAIIMLGGLLIDRKPSTEKWEKVLKEVDSHLGKSGSSVTTVLELSYRNLSPQLKSCFLCVAFFKEDTTIRAKKLIAVWVALGLVPPERGERSMEEIGRSLLDELISRNIIQVEKMTSSNAKAKTCRVHDLIRELSINRAREEIGFQILREEGSSQPLDKPRHCAVNCTYFNPDYFLSSGIQMQHIRSLFFHAVGGVISESPSYWKKFELVKMLDFEGFHFESGCPPDVFGALKGLKYLILRDAISSSIPPTHTLAGENLEVLDLTKNFVLVVPNSIWKMDRLRHLYVEFGSIVPLKKGAMKNLETLGSVFLDHGVLETLTEMTSLRKLGVIVQESTDTEETWTTLAKLEKLARLTMRVHGFHNLDGLGKLQNLTKLELQSEVIKLPHANDFPPNLSSLCLSSTWLGADAISELEKLPGLVYLHLYEAFHEEELVVSAGAFPKLKIFYLLWMPQLHNIKVGEGAMPRLQQLKIEECLNMRVGGVPEKLRPITEFVTYMLVPREAAAEEVQPQQEIAPVDEAAAPEVELAAAQEAEPEKLATADEEPAIETIKEEVSEPPAVEEAHEEVEEEEEVAAAPAEETSATAAAEEAAPVEAIKESAAEVTDEKTKE